MVNAAMYSIPRSGNSMAMIGIPIKPTLPNMVEAMNTDALSPRRPKRLMPQHRSASSRYITAVAPVTGSDIQQAFPGDAGYGIGKQHHRQGDLDHHPGNSVQSCFVQDSALYGCHTNGPVNYRK